MTRDELVTYALTRVTVSAEDTEAVALAQTAISENYRRLAVELELKRERAELPVEGDDAVVDLPNDCAAIKRLRAGTVNLYPVTWDRFASMEAEDVSLGETDENGPRYYVYVAPTRLRVHPAPAEDDNDAVVIDYVVTPAALDASDEPELIPTGYHLILAEHAIAELWLSEEEPGQAQAAEARADRMLRDLKRHLVRRQGTGPDKLPIRGQLARRRY